MIVSINRMMKYIVSLSVKKVIAFFISLILLVSFPIFSLSPPGFHQEWRIPEHELFFVDNHLLFSYQKNEKEFKWIELALGEDWHYKELLNEKVEWYPLAVDFDYSLALYHEKYHDLYLNLCFRWIGQQDIFVFLSFSHNSQDIVPIEYGISWLSSNHRSWNQWQTFVFAYPHDNYSLPDLQYEVKELEKPVFRGEMMYFRSKNEGRTIQTWLKSSVFQYKPLEYGMNERIDIPSSFWVETENDVPVTYTRSLVYPGAMMDDWILYSDAGLINIASARTRRVLQTTDLSKTKRFFRDGFLYRTQGTGFKGEKNNTYYWDYSNFASRSILEYYFSPYERFFYNFVVNNYIALKNHRNDHGYWNTGTISPWLRSLYDIKDDFFDSRFNVDAGLFLLFFYQRYNYCEALNMAAQIGDLLLHYMQRGLGFRAENDGFLLQDYVCEQQPKMLTHASLNHLLNIASFLLMLGDLTEIQYYQNAAVRVFKGLQATEPYWEDQATGDLHYARFTDGNYEGKDYLMLTYHDILRAQNFSIKYLKERNPVLQRLGIIKENFLYEHGHIKTRRIQERETHVYHQWEKAG